MKRIYLRVFVSRKRARGIFVSWPVALVAILLSAGCGADQGQSGPAVESTPHRGAVASAHPLATAAGIEILQMGGNAFDAAVAISAALAVVEPTGSGLGGGGFWLLHRERDGFQTMVDGRERAPLAATRDMYLDEEGNVIQGLSRNGPLAAGIPGEPAALVYIAGTYGSLPLSTLLAPAIKYAREGVALSPSLKRSLERRQDSLNDEAKSIFMAGVIAGGGVPEAGDTIIQEDLAVTLGRLAEKGHDGFYSGETSRLLVESSQSGGGIWSQEDFDSYRVVERDPVVFTFRGARIVSAPPPSSGGIVLAQMMQILEALPDAGSGAAHLHHVIESMRLAYQDRALYLGDSDFADIDIIGLTNNGYAQKKAGSITSVASPSAPYEELVAEGQDTTHFSVIDGEGNRVAGTLSINFSLGAGYIAAGTGIWLNNEMDDFSAKPAFANGYGLVGGSANSIEPGKRPLSSMTPTFVEQGEFVAVLGTPGGSRIITMVLLAAMGILDGLELQQALDQPRFHHQYLPDEVQHESGGFTEEESAELVRRGHKLRMFDRGYGNMHAVSLDRGSGVMQAASDRRGDGEAALLIGTKVQLVESVE